MIVALLASRAWTVKLNSPRFAGVPWRSPVLEWRRTPSGRDPATMLHVKGGVPPLALRRTSNDSLSISLMGSEPLIAVSGSVCACAAHASSRATTAPNANQTRELATISSTVTICAMSVKHLNLLDVSKSSTAAFAAGAEISG